MVCDPDGFGNVTEGLSLKPFSDDRELLVKTQSQEFPFNAIAGRRELVLVSDHSVIMPQAVFRSQAEVIGIITGARQEGARSVKRLVDFYNLDAIISPEGPPRAPVAVASACSPEEQDVVGNAPWLSFNISP